MSSPHHTLSSHKCYLAKIKAPQECTEEEWHLISEVRAKEKAKKIAKEATVREEAAKRAAEAVEERADAERRTLEEQLWEVAGQQSEMVVAPLQVAKRSRRMTMGGSSDPGWRASRVQDPCTRCCNNGTLCILGTAKGKTTACEVCYHTKASCSWLKKMTGETWKQKWVQWSEEMEDMEMIKVGEDNEEEERSHFAVLPHLTEDHWDTLGVLTMMLDKLTMDFLTFQQDSWDLRVTMLKVMEALANELQRSNDLKEEMGKSKGKSKEKAKEEFRRLRTDDDGDMEMGGVGLLFLV
ncbi:hypothetical protein ID866_9731 [Astraeus odoratus]|nr:hypothetical protein ID866_9731 [Astraeus odoratus]